MKIVNPEKIELFEELLNEKVLNESDIVAHTITGKPISRKQYVDNNNKAVTSFEKGNFKSQKDILKKYSAK